MGVVEDMFFAPLGKEYCLYFYYSSIISFIFFAAGLVGGVYHVMQKKMNVFSLVMGLLSPALLYLNNRLLYSMCVGMRHQ